MSSTPTKAGPFLRAQARNMECPSWARLAFWCWGNANTAGHARAFPGQLQQELGFSSAREVSRAIRLAKERRLIDRSSCSACLVLPDHYLAPCGANHGEVRT